MNKSVMHWIDCRWGHKNSLKRVYALSLLREVLFASVSYSMKSLFDIQFKKLNIDNHLMVRSLLSWYRIYESKYKNKTLSKNPQKLLSHLSWLTKVLAVAVTRVKGVSFSKIHISFIFICSGGQTF